MSAELARVLRHAAGVLETRGWCQKHLVDGEGRVCAVGALESTDAVGPLFLCAYRAVEAHLGLRTSLLPAWNDMPGRTREDVVKTFLATADEVEFQ